MSLIFNNLEFDDPESSLDYSDKFDIESQFVKNRILTLRGSVDNYMLAYASKHLLYLDSLNHRDITLFISSPGGSVIDGLAIYDIMKYIKSDIKTVCVGYGASMAAILLSSGTKGKRFAGPNARIMLHQLSTGMAGKLEDLENDIKHSKLLQEVLNNILIQNTGKTKKQLQMDLKKDLWLSSKEAIKYGLIDKILE
jgi:ATP-dependent Clp protease protease subunit